MSYYLKTAEATKNFTEASKVARLHRLTGGDSKTLRIKWDDEALWCFTGFHITRTICEILLKLPDITRRSVIVDAFAGVGGASIIFGAEFSNVISIELNETRKKMLDYNLKLFKRYIVTTHRDYYQRVLDTADVVFFDPPWGLDYRLSAEGRHRIMIKNPRDILVSIEESIIDMKYSVKYLVAKLPVNYDLGYFMEVMNKNDCKIIVNRSYGRPNSMKLLVIKFPGPSERS